MVKISFPFYKLYICTSIDVIGYICIAYICGTNYTKDNLDSLLEFSCSRNVLVV